MPHNPPRDPRVAEAQKRASELLGFGPGSRIRGFNSAGEQDRFANLVQRLLRDPNATAADIPLTDPISPPGTTTLPSGEVIQGTSASQTWRLTDAQGNDRGTTSDPDLVARWQEQGGIATPVSTGGGGDDPDTILEPELIGADGIGGDPQVDPEPVVNRPLTPEGILALFSSGGNTRAETIALLRNLGWNTTRIARALSVAPQPPATTTPVVQEGLEQPEDVTDLLQNLGIGDITRRFAIESGVSPDFRNLVQGRAQQQLLPFALQTARGFDPSQLGEGEKFVDLFSTRRFQEFLQNQGGFQSRGSSLRGAADFLRDRQGDEGDFSEAQKVIRGSLLNLGEEGSPNVGSQLFSRLIAEAQSRGTGGRTIPGINVGRAVGSSLQNIFARDPDRFSKSVPDFVDFLAGRGLI